MADTATAAPEAAPPAVEAKPEDRNAAPAEPTKVDEPPAADLPKDEPAAAPKPAVPEQKPAEPTPETKKEEEAPAAAPAADGDTEMKDAPAENTSAKTTNANRRKSGAGAAKGGNKKGKAKATHIDAKPSDHFLVKLKGFPLWPVIICDEEMLPETLLRTRPVSAARPDGTYGDAYAEGGKRTYDRNFAVMYLATYEFGWVSNQALTELSSEKAKSSINEKQRKDLREAYELAVEQHPVQYYKDLIQKIEDERQAFLAAQEAARAEAAATPKKSKKAKEDTEMTDADGKKSKKRKADDEAATPQRSDSAKKPKIKLMSSASKATNGAAKTKEAAPKKKAEKKEPKLSSEEQRKALEERISWLRYKLQKGLLTGPIEEGAIRGLSDYLKKLETYTDLEASLLKKTKIHKVLKGILKLETIPLEEELQMKPRSRALLDLWNKALAAAAAAAPAVDTSTMDKVNGTNGSAEPTEAPKSEEPQAAPAEAPKEESKDAEVKQSIEEAPKVEEAPAAKAAPVATTE